MSLSHNADSNGNGHEKPWTNGSVLFLHSSIDDAHVPKGAMRVLLHLQRRIGTRTARNKHLNPGIESIAKTCRMRKALVERELRWLERYGFLEITRTRFRNHYKVLVPTSKLRINRRLDDFGLSVVQMRVLAHTARLCGKLSEFYVNKRKFAAICGIDEDSVEHALSDLEELDFLGPMEMRTNPQYSLNLDFAFPQEKAPKRASPCTEKGESVSPKRANLRVSKRNKEIQEEGNPAPPEILPQVPARFSRRFPFRFAVEEEIRNLVTKSS